MTPFRLVETSSTEHSLLLTAGQTRVDDVITSLGHEPNGYFWETIARFVARRGQLNVAALDFDSEAGMFCARGDRSVLERLGEMMAPLANGSAPLRAALREAEAAGVELDD